MHRFIIKKLLTLKLIEMKNFYYYLIGFALLTVLGIYSCDREKLIDYADYKSSEVIEKGFSKISINFITAEGLRVIVLDAKTKLKKINNLERGRLSILKQNNDYSIKYKDNLQIVSLRIPYSSDNFIVETDKL